MYFILRYNPCKMLAKLLASLSRLPQKETWVVGVSGGADSLSLLHALHVCGVTIVAAHFNHQLRDHADRDAVRTAEFAGSLNVNFVLGSGDVLAEARRTRQPVEAAARSMRYAFLFEQALKTKAKVVAVAHTADDQVETILMHILRGAGPAGLKGMPEIWLPNPWSDDIALVRPLLDVNRAETEAYCNQNGLQPVVDETNLDPAYMRNRIRLQLLPTLESFNPAFRSAVLRLANVTRAEQEVLEALTDQIWRRCALSSRTGGQACIRLDLSGLSDQPIAIRRLIARRALHELRSGVPDIDFDTIERICAWMSGQSDLGPYDLPGEVTALRKNGFLWFEDASPRVEHNDWPQMGLEPVHLELQEMIHGVIPLSAGWKLEVLILDDVVKARTQALENQDPYQAWMDLDRLVLPLVIQPRLPGDKFQPLGMAGKSKKLSDVMIDSHIPREARSTWPLLSSGGQVVWIPGVITGHIARVRPETNRVIWFRLSRLG